MQGRWDSNYMMFFWNSLCPWLGLKISMQTHSLRNISVQPQCLSKCDPDLWIQLRFLKLDQYLTTRQGPWLQNNLVVNNSQNPQLMEYPQHQIIDHKISENSKHHHEISDSQNFKVFGSLCPNAQTATKYALCKSLKVQNLNYWRHGEHVFAECSQWCLKIFKFYFTFTPPYRSWSSLCSYKSLASAS